MHEFFASLQFLDPQELGKNLHQTFQAQTQLKLSKKLSAEFQFTRVFWNLYASVYQGPA